MSLVKSVVPDREEFPRIKDGLRTAVHLTLAEDKIGITPEVDAILGAQTVIDELWTTAVWTRCLDVYLVRYSDAPGTFRVVDDELGYTPSTSEPLDEELSHRKILTNFVAVHEEFMHFKASLETYGDAFRRYVTQLDERITSDSTGRYTFRGKPLQIRLVVVLVTSKLVECVPQRQAPFLRIGKAPFYVLTPDQIPDFLAFRHEAERQGHSRTFYDQIHGYFDESRRQIRGRFLITGLGCQVLLLSLFSWLSAGIFTALSVLNFGLHLWRYRCYVSLHSAHGALKIPLSNFYADSQALEAQIKFLWPLLPERYCYQLVADFSPWLSAQGTEQLLSRNNIAIETKEHGIQEKLQEPMDAAAFIPPSVEEESELGSAEAEKQTESSTIQHALQFIQDLKAGKPVPDMADGESGTIESAINPELRQQIEALGPRMREVFLNFLGE